MTPKEKRNRYLKIAALSIAFDGEIYDLAQKAAVKIMDAEEPITKDLLIKQFIERVSDKRGLASPPENMNYTIDMMEVILECGDKIRVSSNRITHFMFGNQLCLTEFPLSQDEYNNLKQYF